jgi:hypothetical protein
MNCDLITVYQITVCGPLEYIKELNLIKCSDL